MQVLTLLAALAVAAILRAAEAQGPTIVDFAAGASAWRSVDDDVMGGLSRSGMRATDQRTALFEGELSLENNGGFASVRALLGPTDLSAFTGLALRVRGDGRTYQVRLRTSARFDGVAYRARFTPRRGEWDVVEIPFSAFVPTFRGRRPAGAPPLDASDIVQLGLLIGDGQVGPFALEIAWVRGYS